MKDISIYQWDKDLTIDSDSPVLFCAKGDKDGLVVAPKGGKVSIPNQLTAKGKDIAAYAMDGAHVKDSCWIRVTAVAKPSNYVFTETEIDSIESFKDFAVAAIQAAQDEYKGVADDAKKALAEIQEQVKLIEAAENSRKQAEGARVAAEQQRETTFGSWTLEESKRSKQEQSRVVAEAKRESDTKAAINNLNSEITKANSKVDSAVNGANAKVDVLVNTTNTKTDAQIALAKEATDKANASAGKADTATGKANEATVAATNAATKANEVESKLTGNILKGKAKDAFIHVDDAFPSSLLGVEIEGATEQVTTTGKNLLDCHKLAEILSEYYAVENGNIKAIKSCNLAWSNVPALITLDAGTYYSSGDKTLEIRKASDNSTLLYGEGKFTLNQTTEIKIKAGTGLPSYPVVIKAQIEKGSTATAYETYTGGKPSPSPDFPQEIKVVENPTIKINGKNLLDFSFPAYYAAYASGVAYIKSDSKTAMLPLTTSINSANGFGFVVKLKAGGTYTLKTFNAPSKAVACIAFYSDISRIYSAANKISYVKEKPLTEPISFSVQEGAEYAVICFAAEWGNGKTQITYPENFKVQVEISDNVTDYTPYLRAEQAFTLPLEHPYLAKVRDVADDIKVDKDGNVSLIARVTKTLPSNNELSWGAGTDTDSAYASYKVDGIANKNGICCNRYIASNWTNESGYVYCPNGADIAIRDNRFTSREKAVELLKGVIVYVETNEKTYNLGKINLPALPESVSNVWTDAEITPRTTIEYTKDVNIAYDKLANAIVASVGGEANVS